LPNGLAAGDVGVDPRPLERREGHVRDAREQARPPALATATAVMTDASAREQAEDSCGVGGIDGLGEDAPAERDGGVGAEDRRLGQPARGEASSAPRPPWRA
jgi:hypothetical protein